MRTPDTVITQPDDIVNIWKHIFKTSCRYKITVTNSFLTCDLPTEEPTDDQVKKAVAELKNYNKDNIPSEFLKNEWKIMHQQIYNLIIHIWNEE